MIDDNLIIEKIRKLLALSNSSNEHEAALAAGHAQRLLSEHNLAMADIEAKEPPQSADRVETSVAKALPKWVRHLSAGVCSAFDCQAIHHPAYGKLTFIGVGADVQIAAYTFAYLDKSIRKLCTRYLKDNAATLIPARQRELIRHSYYLGAVSTINIRLRNQKRQTPTTPGAMVPVKEGLIKKAMDDAGATRTIRSRRSYINAQAYNRGQSDGRNVEIVKGLGGNTGLNAIEGAWAG